MNMINFDENSTSIIIAIVIALVGAALISIKVVKNKNKVKIKNNTVFNGNITGIKKSK